MVSEKVEVFFLRQEKKEYVRQTIFYGKIKLCSEL